MAAASNERSGVVLYEVVQPLGEIGVDARCVCVGIEVLLNADVRRGGLDRAAGPLVERPKATLPSRRSRKAAKQEGRNVVMTACQRTDSDGCGVAMMGIVHRSVPRLPCDSQSAASSNSRTSSAKPEPRIRSSIYAGRFDLDDGGNPHRARAAATVLSLTPIRLRDRQVRLIPALVLQLEQRHSARSPGDDFSGTTPEPGPHRVSTPVGCRGHVGHVGLHGVRRGCGFRTRRGPRRGSSERPEFRTASESREDPAGCPARRSTAGTTGVTGTSGRRAGRTGLLRPVFPWWCPSHF